MMKPDLIFKIAILTAFSLALNSQAETRKLTSDEFSFLISAKGTVRQNAIMNSDATTLYDICTITSEVTDSRRTQISCPIEFDIQKGTIVFAVTRINKEITTAHILTLDLN